MANDFLPFSTSGTANVYTNAEYTADTDHTNGNQPGIAKSKLVNKALRQCSIISTVVAQYIADITGTNAVDDGTTTTLLTNLKTATNVAYNTHAATSKVTPVDADEIPIVDSAASNGLKKITFANLATYFTSLFAPIDSPTFTGTPSLPTGTIAVTQPAGTNTTQVATTAFVKTEIPNALNVTGSAPIYACRAWVNFNGTGTVAIRGSGNVSSITDTGVGTYTINFTTAMPDANYAITTSVGGATADLPIIFTGGFLTTSVNCSISKNLSNAGVDVTDVGITILR